MGLEKLGTGENDQSVMVDDFEVRTKILGEKNTKGVKCLRKGHIEKQRPLNHKELTGESNKDFLKKAADIKSGEVEKYI